MPQKRVAYFYDGELRTIIDRLSLLTFFSRCWILFVWFRSPHETPSHTYDP